jgi:HD-GYP domain-containing protein (c-di-GMP phosphodiesterase class II)
MLGRTLGFDEVRLKQLAQTAMLHDVGKLLVPEFILYKPDRPTQFELYVLRSHPRLGAMLAVHYNLSPELRVRTRHHHERWDGRGYPNRLGGEDIPLQARVVQVADAFDAMVEQRHYNTPRTHEDAAKELRRGSGSQFDPGMVEAFLDSFSKGRKLVA